MASRWPGVMATSALQDCPWITIKSWIHCPWNSGRGSSPSPRASGNPGRRESESESEGGCARAGEGGTGEVLDETAETPKLLILAGQRYGPLVVSDGAF